MKQLQLTKGVLAMALSKKSHQSLVRHPMLHAALTICLLLSACSGQAGPAEQLKTVRVVFGAGGLSPMLAGQTVGMPLGYYKAEGLKLEIVAAPGGGSSQQSLAVGQAEYGIVVAPPFINATAESGDLGIVDACNMTARIHWQLWTGPDEPISSVDDLIGKRVGVISFGDSEHVGLRKTLEQRGIDPDRDVKIVAVGQGEPAGQALEKGDVDVLAMWDGAIATIQQLGYEMVRIPNPKEWNELFGFGFGVRRDYLEENREEVAGFCRAAAKSEVFAMTNPEAAIKLHWQVAPESRPTGSEQAALQSSLAPLEARIPNWTPCGEVKCQEWQWGWHNPEHWDATVSFLGLEERIGDSSGFYTNDLIKEINSFDIEKIIDEARNYNVK